MAATRAAWSMPRATRTAVSPPRCWPPRIAHTPEGEEVLRGARMRAARKPSAVARELLRNFPKSGGRRRRRKRKGASKDGGAPERNGAAAEAGAEHADEHELEELEVTESENGAAPESEEAEPDESSRRVTAETELEATDAPRRLAAERQLDLAGAQGHSLAIAPLDDQVAALVDLLGDALAAVP